MGLRQNLRYGGGVSAAMSDAAATTAEIATLLTRIQEATRVYPTQAEGARRMTFATIRTAAETVGTLAEDTYAGSVAEEVRHHVNAITGALDELGDRFGSEEAGRCRACGRALAKARLGAGGEMAYCTYCPQPILEAVREVSDVTGAEVL